MLAVENEGEFSLDGKKKKTQKTHKPFISVKPPILKGEPNPSYLYNHPSIYHLLN